jgi:hypothetical protein
MRVAFGTCALVGCATAHVGHGSVVPLRDACTADAYWTGRACTSTADVHAKLDAGRQALVEFRVDDARAALDAAERAGPLDHESNITLWEQRGIAASYLDDVSGATRAFDMLLALDPGHFLSYKLSPKATFVFEKVRDGARARPAPQIDVAWPHDGRVGEPLPIGVEVVADPKHFLDRATVFVRERGMPTWRATDVALGKAGEHRVLLPPVAATGMGEKATSLELYLRGYDQEGNEVLAWADATRPREILLRYEPPARWYRKWWVIAAAATVLAGVTGVIVYEATVSPPAKIRGSVSVH